MTAFKHHRASYGAEVDMPIDEFFDAAADWTALLDHLPEWHPFKFTHISVAEGSQAGRLPCTRIMHLDKTALPEGTPPDSIPDEFRETLLVADKDAGTLVYRVEGNALGMRNYYATKELEKVGPARCRATINARFDLPADAASGPLIAALVEVYRGVIHGIADSRQTA